MCLLSCAFFIPTGVNRLVKTKFSVTLEPRSLWSIGPYPESPEVHTLYDHPCLRASKTPPRKCTIASDRRLARLAKFFLARLTFARGLYQVQLKQLLGTTTTTTTTTTTATTTTTTTTATCPNNLVANLIILLPPFSQNTSSDSRVARPWSNGSPAHMHWWRSSLRSRPGPSLQPRAIVPRPLAIRNLRFMSFMCFFLIPDLSFARKQEMWILDFCYDQLIFYKPFLIWKTFDNKKSDPINMLEARILLQWSRWCRSPNPSAFDISKWRKITIIFGNLVSCLLTSSSVKKGQVVSSILQNHLKNICINCRWH